MFNKVLIANRGAIACRIIRTLRILGIVSVAVYSEADRRSLHVQQADESVFIGPAAATASYLSIDKVIGAAVESGADAIHPGYGFLSEKPDFADACEAAGIVFIGPTGDQMRSFGLKHTARALASKMGLPLLPGTGLLATVEDAQKSAFEIGFPVMLKSTAGGGGIGIRLCKNASELDAAFSAVRSLGQNNFGDGGAFLEKFIAAARHIEVQIFGDGIGGVLALGERDCSAQRRNQKVIEETPAPGVFAETRQRLIENSVKIGQAVNYRSAGTVEYVYDNTSDEFYFLEVNTRLQVEHGVTEEVTGIDLVAWMVLQASGDLQPLTNFKVEPIGHSIEVRLYAEDAGANFQPSSGRLSRVQFPADVRTETWVESGTEISPYYDPMIAKIIVHGSDRQSAISKMTSALGNTELYGIETNLDYLLHVCRSREFVDAEITTSFLSKFAYERSAIVVVSGGTQTTVQDYPGRIGYWNIGVPPSGPMDSLAFRIANRLVGNDASASALEITLSGPILKFGASTTIALTGAGAGSAVDGMPVPMWSSLQVAAGSVLKVGSVGGVGMRCYLAVAGGFDVATYLGSRSTFMLGRFGGHDGRALRPGDVVHMRDSGQAEHAPAQLSPSVQPTYTNAWTIGVLYGPHVAPDFFLDADIEMFFSTSWKVHHQSDRTGVRLIGPKPQWARLDGGEAGLHPSNIHDNAYAIGAVDFTGDMPIILGPDGPSLGGFVCPAVIVQAELWKIGQLRPGDTIKFIPVTFAQAEDLSESLERTVESLARQLGELPQASPGTPIETPILSERTATAEAPAVVIRSDGDRYLLIEFGPKVLDLKLRLRVYSLEAGILRMALPGIIDITAGVRSLQIHYDTAKIGRDELLAAIQSAEQAIPADLDITVPSRIVHLPISWNDPQAQLAMRKYMETVRPDAPWCPDNIEFIRRINGLHSIDDVYRTIFDANYLVLGLGDVYLGAPVATPIDPRHRLVTTKYNPARTWTPENAVGIGGAYMCIYGMEGPGGYQLFGRTTQVWNTFKSTKDFEPGTPWLLRHFDQIKFYPVSAHTLLQMRDGFPHGDYQLQIEHTELKYGEYLDFLSSISAEAKASRERQQSAFEAERGRWAAAGQLIVASGIDEDEPQLESPDIPDGYIAVESPMVSSVWKVLVEPEQIVRVGDSLLILSAMKTETVVASPVAGRVVEVRIKPDALVMHGQTLIVLEETS